MLRISIIRCPHTEHYYECFLTRSLARTERSHSTKNCLSYNIRSLWHNHQQEKMAIARATFATQHLTSNSNHLALTANQNEINIDIPDSNSACIPHYSYKKTNNNNYHLQLCTRKHIRRELPRLDLIHIRHRNRLTQMCMVIPQPCPTIRCSFFGVVEFWTTKERADNRAAETDVMYETKFPARVRGGEEVGCLHWAGPYGIRE